MKQIAFALALALTAPAAWAADKLPLSQISNYLNGTMQGLIIIVAVMLQRANWGKSAKKKT